MSNNSFENKIILIAGASGGIGSAILDRLAYSGTRIIAIYNNNFPMYKTSENILSVKADLQNPVEWDRVFHLVYQNYGRIDIFINCTGVLIPGNFNNHRQPDCRLVDCRLQTTYSLFLYNRLESST